MNQSRSTTAPVSFWARTRLALVALAVGIGIAACAPAQSPGGSAYWPPSNALRDGMFWAVAFENGQKFSGRIEGKDSEGDWTGSGSGGLTLFTFALNNGGFAFQVLEKTGGPSWFCVLRDASSYQDDVYIGSGAYTANKNSPLQDLKQSCGVAFGR